MIPFVTYFGDGAFRPLAARFVEQFRAVSPAPLAVLTDRTTPVDFATQVVRVDPTPYLQTYHRAGRPGAGFDYKACLILALLEADGPPDDCLIMDCDNLIYRDPVAALRTLFAGGGDLAGRQDRIAIGADPGQREIKHPCFGGPVIEQSSSILYIPKETAGDLARDYRALWNTTTEPTHELLEQRTWTLVAQNNHGSLLPWEFSWSRVWGAPPAACVLKHCHGDEKWKAA